MSSMASLEHTTFHHPPVLTSGEITPKVLMEFEQTCHYFFTHAKGGVTDEARVSRILPCFQDQLVRDWISLDRVRISALTFDAFLVELRKAFLPRNWEDKIQAQILGDCLHSGICLLTWANSLQTLNCVLRGTQSHLNDQ